MRMHSHESSRCGAHTCRQDASRFAPILHQKLSYSARSLKKSNWERSCWSVKPRQVGIYGFSLTCPMDTAKNLLSSGMPARAYHSIQLRGKRQLPLHGSPNSSTLVTVLSLSKEG